MFASPVKWSIARVSAQSDLAILSESMYNSTAALSSFSHSYRSRCPLLPIRWLHVCQVDVVVVVVLLLLLRCPPRLLFFCFLLLSSFLLVVFLLFFFFFFLGSLLLFVFVFAHVEPQILKVMCRQLMAGEWRLVICIPPHQCVASSEALRPLPTSAHPTHSAVRLLRLTHFRDFPTSAAVMCLKQPKMMCDTLHQQNKGIR